MNNTNEQTSVLSNFSPELLTSFEAWIMAQFSDFYTPSGSNVKRFMETFLFENVKDYGMGTDITWDELWGDWNLDESFMDYFGE